MILLLENKIRGGISSVMGNRYVKPDDNRKIINVDATILYGHSMSQMLPYDEIAMWYGHPDLYLNKLEEFLSLPDDSNICYFIEVDLKYPDNKKEKTKKHHFCPENEICNKNDFNDYMNKNQILIHKIKS